MTTSKGANQYNRQNWEEADFPILCETCLGDNYVMRMTKERHGKECKTCKRPFTIFRWKAGTTGRFKKTEVCQVCARTKNVCQTCILDLEFGLPVELRDQELRIQQNLPRGPVNREFGQQQLEASLEAAADPLAPYAGIDASSAAGAKRLRGSDMLLKMARTEPYYKRNRPHVCSFFAKGECRRGEECPFRHEKPTDPDDPLSQQNIRDRFFGVNDPVAASMRDKYKSAPRPTAPEDRTVTTLYLGGVTELVTEAAIRAELYQYGEIRSVTVRPHQRCAFVQFATREGAERAADKCHDNRLIVANTRLSVNWGRPHAATSASGSQVACQRQLPPVPGLPPAGMLPPPPLFWSGHPTFVPPPPPPPPISAARTGNPTDAPGMHYPSQDPARMGGQYPH